MSILVGTFNPDLLEGAWFDSDLPPMGQYNWEMVAYANAWPVDVTLPVTAGLSEAATVDAVASTSLAVTAAETQSDTVTAVAAAALNAVAAQIESNLLTAVAAESLSAAASQIESNGLDAVSDQTFVVSANDAHSATLTIDTACALLSTTGFSTSVLLDAVGELTISTNPDLLFSCLLVLAVQQTLAVDAGLVSLGGINQFGDITFSAVGGFFTTFHIDHLVPPEAPTSGGAAPKIHSAHRVHPAIVSAKVDELPTTPAPRPRIVRGRLRR